MKTIEWLGDRLRLIDQTRLPAEVRLIDCRTADEVAAAIRDLKVRGAPAIGVTAAYGVVLAASQSHAREPSELWDDVRAAAETLRRARPTAVNLARAVDRVIETARGATSVAEARRRLLAAARHLADEDERVNRQMGAFGAALVPDGANVLTHCNTGSLATTGYGTALGVVRAAREAGKRIHVWVDETRPVLQGARLTAWELLTDAIPHSVIPDSAAGFLMARGQVDLVVVGADRVAANGDVANKIGTYALAVLARHHGLPFYVAAPTFSIDLATASGREIPIEERDPDEVRRVAGVPIAPADSPALNLAFDLTPADLVTGIITERGVAVAPYLESLRGLAAGVPELTVGGRRANIG